MIVRFSKKTTLTLVFSWIQIFALSLAPILGDLYAGVVDGHSDPIAGSVNAPHAPAPINEDPATADPAEVDRTLQLLRQGTQSSEPVNTKAKTAGALDPNIAKLFFWADQRATVKTPRGLIRSTTTAVEELFQATQYKLLKSNAATTVYDIGHAVIKKLPATGVRNATRQTWESLFPSEPPRKIDAATRWAQLKDALTGKFYRASQKFPRLSSVVTRAGSYVYRASQKFPRLSDLLGRVGLHLPAPANSDVGRFTQNIDYREDPSYLSPAAFLFVKSTDELKLTLENELGQKTNHLKVVYQSKGSAYDGSAAEVDLPPNVVPLAATQDGTIGTFVSEKGELYAFFLYAYRFSFGRQPLLIAKIRNFDLSSPESGTYSLEINQGPFSRKNAQISPKLKGEHPEGLENGALLLVQTSKTGYRTIVNLVERKELLTQLAIRHILGALVLKGENPSVEVPNFPADVMAEVQQELDDHPEILDLANKAEYEQVVRVLQAKTVNEALASLNGALARSKSNRKFSWSEYVNSDKIHLSAASHFILNEVLNSEDEDANPDAVVAATLRSFRDEAYRQYKDGMAKENAGPLKPLPNPESDHLTQVLTMASIIDHADHFKDRRDQILEAIPILKSFIESSGTPFSSWTWAFGAQSKMSESEKEIIRLVFEPQDISLDPYDNPSARIVSGALWELKAKIDAYVEVNQASAEAKSLQTISQNIDTALTRSPSAEALEKNLAKLRTKIEKTPELNVTSLLAATTPDDEPELAKYIEQARLVHPAMMPALKRFGTTSSGRFLKSAFKLVIDPPHLIFLLTTGFIFSGALIEKGLQVPAGTGSAFFEHGLRPMMNFVANHFDTIVDGNYRPWLAISLLVDYSFIKGLKLLLVGYGKVTNPAEHASYTNQQGSLNLYRRVLLPLIVGVGRLVRQQNLLEALSNGFLPTLENGGLHGIGSNASDPNPNYDLFGLNLEQQAIFGLCSEKINKSDLSVDRQDEILSAVVARLRESAALSDFSSDANVAQNEPDAEVIALVQEAATNYEAGSRPDPKSPIVREARRRLLNHVQERNVRLATVKEIAYKAAIEAEGISTANTTSLPQLEFRLRDVRKQQRDDFEVNLKAELEETAKNPNPRALAIAKTDVEREIHLYNLKVQNSNSRIDYITRLVADRLDQSGKLLGMKFAEGLNAEQTSTLQAAADVLARSQGSRTTIGLGLDNLVGQTKFWFKYRSAAILTYPLGTWEAASRAIPRRGNARNIWNQWETDLVGSFPLEALIGNRFYSLFGLPHIESRADLNDRANLAARPQFFKRGTHDMPGALGWNNTDKVSADVRQNWVYSADAQARNPFEFGGGSPDNPYDAVQIVPENQKFENAGKTWMDFFRALKNLRQSGIVESAENSAKTNVRFMQPRFLFYGSFSHFIQGVAWIDGFTQELFFRWNAWQAFAWPWTVINGAQSYLEQTYKDFNGRYNEHLTNLKAALEEARLYSGDKSEANQQYKDILNKARRSYFEMSEVYRENRRKLPTENEIVGSKTLDEITSDDLYRLAKSATENPAAMREVSQGVNKSLALIGTLSTTILAIPFTIAVVGAKLTRGDKVYRAAKGFLFFPALGIAYRGYRWLAERVIDPISYRFKGERNAVDSADPKLYAKQRSALLEDAHSKAKVQISSEVKAKQIDERQAKEKLDRAQEIYTTELAKIKAQRDLLHPLSGPYRSGLKTRACLNAFKTVAKDVRNAAKSIIVPDSSPLESQP